MAAVLLTIVNQFVSRRKEKLVEMFDLATQEDMDELRRNISRLEETLAAVRESGRKSKKEVQ